MIDGPNVTEYARDAIEQDAGPRCPYCREPIEWCGGECDGPDGYEGCECGHPDCGAC